MTPGERQYDIAIIIARKPGRDVMTLRERCDDTNRDNCGERGLERMPGG